MAERIFFMLLSSTKLFNSVGKVLSFKLPKIVGYVYENWLFYCSIKLKK